MYESGSLRNLGSDADCLLFEIEDRNLASLELAVIR